MTTFHVELLDKISAVAIARHFGLRRDWARVKLSELHASLKAFPADRLLVAAKCLPEHFNDGLLAALTDESAIIDVTPKHEEEHQPITVDAAPVAAAAPKAVKPEAPNVTQVAALLAQLLATGKAGLDADEVRGIVQPVVYDTEQRLTRSLLSTVADWVQEAKDMIKAMPPREIVVKTEHTEVKIDGRQHRDFETLLELCAATTPDGHRMNIWMYGPPGTGKTTAAMNAARALSMTFYCNGALSTKYELTGFVDAGGKLVRTPFRDAWENGGVYLFDEIDGSDPKAVVAFNAALANGIMAFPDGMVQRHKDAVMIAASNTVHGATAEFTGRMKLDAATIDRFLMLPWEIDEDLERAMCSNDEWVETVQQFRRKVKAKGVKVAITPRATIYGDALLKRGMKVKTVKNLVLRKAMTDEQWKILEA